MAATVGLLALVATPAQAASLHVVFPQSVEVTVTQGQSTTVTMEVTAQGATRCSATTAPVRVDGVYSIDAAGDVASGQPADIPITTSENRGSSDNCSIANPVLVPVTATAASTTPVRNYTSVIRYGKGGDGGVDLDGPPLIIHVVAPPAAPVVVLPTPELAPPPEILVLGIRKAKPRPTLGKTLLLTLVKGSVYFTPPGGASTVLGDPMVVPNGTLIVPGSGVVKVTVVHDATGVLDSVDAWGTSFKGSQGAGKKPVTTLTLTASAVGARKLARAARTAAKRSLWVNGKGNFKTRGKRASAIVRGTYWVTEETSAGTRVKVNRGLVAVRDFVRKTTVLVSAGHDYTARPRRAVIRRIPAFTGSLGNSHR